MIARITSKLYYLILFILIVSLVACVSRIRPLKKIRPLSGLCEDYILFSDSLTKQRDLGFSKRATISLAGFSVANEANRAVLLETYKPIIEIIYADFFLSVDAVTVFAKVQCENKLNKNWELLANRRYKDVAKTVRFCRIDNHSNVYMERCILKAVKNTQGEKSLNIGSPDLIKRQKLDAFYGNTFYYE